jgi:hypothetical protein
MVAMAAVAPRLTQLYLEQTASQGQRRSDEAASGDALYTASHDSRTRGRQPGYVMQSSAYTRAVVSDAFRAAPLIAAGLLLAVGVRAWRT